MSFPISLNNKKSCQCESCYSQAGCWDFELSDPEMLAGELEWETLEGEEQDFEMLADEAEWEAREAEVIDHENAHMAAGGGWVGAPSYVVEVMPNGKSYIVAGEVSVDMSFDPSKPDEMIAKMTTIIAAALAPGDPSAQDLAVAGEASALRTKAMGIKEEKNRGENQESKSVLDQLPIFQ